MSDTRRLVMTRDQVEKVTGDNHQRIKEFEKLLNAIDADPVEPITVAITGDTTYTLANELGTQTILIPEAMLKASAGGPFTLTITTGVGDSVLVPIGAAGDTILSGDLLFDIYIDSSGNVISKAWSIEGSNANGNYILYSNGYAYQFGTGSATTTTNAPNSLGSTSGNTFFIEVAGISFPKAVVSVKSYGSFMNNSSVGNLASMNTATVSTYKIIVSSGPTNGVLISYSWFMDGVWK